MAMEPVTPSIGLELPGITYAEPCYAETLDWMLCDGLAALGRPEGTVKAQTNAIYRKAGVSGRSQLLSLFIEDLMEPDTATKPRAAGQPSP